MKSLFGALACLVLLFAPANVLADNFKEIEKEPNHLQDHPIAYGLGFASGILVPGLGFIAGVGVPFIIHREDPAKAESILPACGALIAGHLQGVMVHAAMAVALVLRNVVNIVNPAEFRVFVPYSFLATLTPWENLSIKKRDKTEGKYPITVEEFNAMVYALNTQTIGLDPETNRADALLKRPSPRR